MTTGSGAVATGAADGVTVGVGNEALVPMSAASAKLSAGLLFGCGRRMGLVRFFVATIVFAGVAVTPRSIAETTRVGSKLRGAVARSLAGADATARSFWRSSGRVADCSLLVPQAPASTASERVATLTSFGMCSTSVWRQTAWSTRARNAYNAPAQKPFGCAFPDASCPLAETTVVLQPGQPRRRAASRVFDARVCRVTDVPRARSSNHSRDTHVQLSPTPDDPIRDGIVRSRRRRVDGMCDTVERATRRHRARGDRRHIATDDRLGLRHHEAGR